MKKFLVILFFILFLQSSAFATKVSFVYINGSNNNNPKMSNWYEDGVKKLHTSLKAKFDKADYFKSHYKNSEDIEIKPQPVIYFWGNKSKQEYNFVKEQASISKAISTYGASVARNFILECLHDAIWVQKPHNMATVLDDLNIYVKREASEGYEVVLYGYSAGAFVTYEYLHNKLRYINLYNLFSELNMDKNFLDYVKKNPRNNTCLSAINDGYYGLGTFNNNGHLVLNQNKEQLKKNYYNINKRTEEYCAPAKKIRGVVNFACPLVLFYSDMSDPLYEANYYTKLMMKYIYEHGIFMLTVNFKEDPLGYPTTRNLTISEAEKALNTKINNPTGVIYDNSNVWSSRPFFVAHISYWSANKTFAKAVVNTFIEGYRFLYDEEYQAEILKKRKTAK